MNTDNSSLNSNDAKRESGRKYNINIDPEVFDKYKDELEYTQDMDSYSKLISDDVLELLSVFHDQGHSGLSAVFAIDMFSRLAKDLPLSNLTGKENEWSANKHWLDKHSYRQYNKRYDEVFRETVVDSNGDPIERHAYNCRNKIFSDDGGITFYSSTKSIEEITFPYAVPYTPEAIILKNDD